MPPHWFWVTALFALAGLQRLSELFLSRRFLAPDLRAGQASILREPVYPYMVALHSGWLLAGWLEGVWFPAAPNLVVQTGSALALGLALALRAWMLAVMGPRWHVRVVRRSDQPIVNTGPYRFIRHPNYLAVVLEMAAVPLLAGAPWSAALASLANAGVLWRRIGLEEAYLMKHPAYREAFANKARFIPGLF